MSRLPEAAPPVNSPFAGSPRACAAWRELPMSLGSILLVVLLLMVVGAIPRWPHSANWGYLPSGGLGLILLVVLILVLLGRI